jgi:Zn-dependent protease with chaperone function
VIWPLLVPAGIALVACGGFGVVHRRLPPRAATWVLTSLIAVTGLAMLWALATLAFGFLVQHVSWLDVDWCRPLSRPHDHVPTALGVGAVGSLLFMAAGAGLSRRRYRRYTSLPGDDVEILPTMTPLAMALPGRPGRIVVSTGMLRCLEADELRVLFAHEEAHLRHRHCRFLAVAGLVATSLPILRPTLRQVQHATERWADETAARVVGDRRLVARAIARAALAKHGEVPPPLPGMAASSVAARVEALMRPGSPNVATTVPLWALGLVSLAVATAGATLQLHHLVAFALHIC